MQSRVRRSTSSAEECELDHQRRREALEPGLRGGLIRLASIAERRHAGHVDDAAPTRCGHRRLRRARHEESPAQMHVYH